MVAPKPRKYWWKCSTFLKKTCHLLTVLWAGKHETRVETPPKNLEKKCCYFHEIHSRLTQSVNAEETHRPPLAFYHCYFFFLCFLDFLALNNSHLMKTPNPLGVGAHVPVYPRFLSHPPSTLSLIEVNPVTAIASVSVITQTARKKWSSLKST